MLLVLPGLINHMNNVLKYSGTSLTRTPRDPRDLYSLSGVRINEVLKYMVYFLNWVV